MLRASQSCEALFANRNAQAIGSAWTCKGEERASLPTQNIEKKEKKGMDDDTGAQTLQALWINWTDHIVSFHAEDGYERLEFSSSEEKMEYVFHKSANGFRIQ